MLKGLLNHRRSHEPAKTPDDTAIYAIGDVHGRLDLLRALLDAIVKDAFSLAESDRRIVLLGDYIDRGQDSRGVIELLTKLTDQAQPRVHALRGNHEQLLLDFLQDPSVGTAWCQWGGRETLLSYGVQPPAGAGDPTAWAAARDALAEAMPDYHLEFIRSLNLSLTLGGYFFVHAGVRPGVPLEDQTPQDLLWIRDPFLKHSGWFGKTVIHGHTAATTLYADENRVALDTGAYGTSKLSAVRLRGDRRSFLQTRKEGGRILVGEIAG